MKYKILLALMCLTVPFPALAKSRYTIVSSENTLTITGTCDADVRFTLLSSENSEKTVYSSGAACTNGQFSYSDNLMQWNIPEGKYALLVDRTSSREAVTIKKVIAPNVPSAESSDMHTQQKEDSAPQLSPFEQAMSDFGNELQSMSQSLGVIEENLSRSDYTGGTAKRVIVGFLREALDSLSGFFTEFKNTTGDVPVPDQSVPATPDPALTTNPVPAPSETAPESTTGDIGSDQTPVSTATVSTPTAATDTITSEDASSQTTTPVQSSPTDTTTPSTTSSGTDTSVSSSPYADSQSQ